MSSHYIWISFVCPTSSGLLAASQPIQNRVSNKSMVNIIRVHVISLTGGRDKRPTADFSKFDKTTITVERVSETDDLRYKLVKKMQQVSVDELNIRVRQEITAWFKVIEIAH